MNKITGQLAKGLQGVSALFPVKTQTPSLNRKVELPKSFSMPEPFSGKQLLDEALFQNTPKLIREAFRYVQSRVLDEDSARALRIAEQTALDFIEGTDQAKKYSNAEIGELLNLVPKSNKAAEESFKQSTTQTVKSFDSYIVQVEKALGNNELAKAALTLARKNAMFHILYESLSQHKDK